METPQLVMLKPSLTTLPEITLPTNFSIRTFQPGDEIAWDTIVSTAFLQTMRFDEIMSTSPSFRPERIGFVITPDGIPAATASAWEAPRWTAILGQDTGYVHYVAALPQIAGLGIGRAITLWTLHKMRTEGRQRAVLETDDHRLSAVSVYLKLGFEPLLIAENQRQRWPALFSQLNRPELADTFAAQLSAPIIKI